VSSVSSPVFWEDLYRSHGDGWELNRPAPALEDWLNLPRHGRGGRDGADPLGRDDSGGAETPMGRPKVAVPGCGRGHDARLLARRGHDVWGFDFAEEAIRAARALAEREGTAVRFERRDIFTLAADFPNAFDGVWEYTCYCAIDPERRPEYVEVLQRILKPGGWLAACFYPIRAGGGGPPFPVDKKEVQRLLAPGFRIERESTPRSVPSRGGQEWMIIASRTA
jgi:methyl halide transferase